LPCAWVTASPQAFSEQFSNYAWQYWRPAWRILQDSDAPPDVKAIVKDAMLSCGDRLAFCRSWERVNGNAFAQLVAALRYCHEATGDPASFQAPRQCPRGRRCYRGAADAVTLIAHGLAW